MDNGGGGITKSGVIITESRERMRIQNPFTLKVGQVFTGFGIGCGLGIGVGRPFNLGAIPVMNQVMSATSGATNAFSGVSRHVNNSLRKLGAKNIEAGIGCGVGFGHGFGAGLAVKRGVIHQIQSSLVEAVTKMMTKFRLAPNLPFHQSLVTQSPQGGMAPFNQNPIGSVVPLATKALEHLSESSTMNGDTSASSSYETLSPRKPSTDLSCGSRTEKVISNFLQSPILNDEDSIANQPAEHQWSETDMLHMVLKHQLLLEELKKENEKLCQILVDELNVHPSKLRISNSRGALPCTDCIECRRKQRRR